MRKLFFRHALLPSGWARDVLIGVDAQGGIATVETDQPIPPKGVDGGVALPGMANLHSHAFQRGMAGLAENAGPGDRADSFWSWRETMYHFLARLSPDDVKAIAAQAYMEMLEAGFTHVAEFHYLHHDPEGRPYADIGEMAAALAAAAQEAGIGLTLLPVFYAQSGFGGQGVAAGQRRFHTDPACYARIHARCGEILKALPHARLGVAPHSLRAVAPDSLTEILKLSASGPIHIHIAEQPQEVADCQQRTGLRPVDWLMAHQPVDARWCLVHATHISEAERRAIAASGAVAGLCPVTEANLGDGLFPAAEFLREGGRFGIGTDSNVRISLSEELRLLEYGQRLRHHRRALLARPGGSTGRNLYSQALSGGAQAAGQPIGALAPGRRADIVALNAEHPALIARHGDAWLDGWIFAANNGALDKLWVAGGLLVETGKHRRHSLIARRFVKTMQSLLQD